MNVEGGMDGTGFLDPIPEDVSVVAASQHAANLSTVSAVASSDSGFMAAPRAQIASKKRRRWKQDGTDPSRILGTAMEDTLSDANASLGGANEQSLEIPFPAPTKEEDPSQKSIFSSPNCKKWLLIISVLVVMSGIGVVVIVATLPKNTEEESASIGGLSMAPTPNPNFSPFKVTYSTSPPVSPPPYTLEEVTILDGIFLKVPGTNVKNIADMNTPEGKGRDWMVNSDTAMNINDERRVKQRYVMCVLYFATNGDFWTKKGNWLDSERSECDWHGVSCYSGNDNIRSINLPENNVTGTLPNEIVSLPTLAFLNMSYDSISGSIPENIFDRLGGLGTLDLKENQLVGSIPERRTSISNSVLRYIDLGTNQLTGTFPFFQDIESVSFDKNNLTTIDRRYFTSSPSLKKFSGFHNELSGPLPPVWNLPNLIELDLGYNFLTGTIPRDLWNLPSLKTLWLDHCNLTGSLPTYTESDSMHRLWLDSNSLSGAIPLNFGWNWTKLYSVKLQENKLTGSITVEQCDRWNALNSMAVSGIESISSFRGNTWTFDADCQIDCACCTSANCSSINFGGR